MRSSAAPLALLFAALIAYASLYPFTGWRWPPGHELASLMVLRWPHWHARFDVFANFVGYLPLGTLACAAFVRRGWRPATAFATAAVAGILLSYALEFAQNFLPERVSSLEDWLLNGAGAVGGALLGVVLHATGALDRWHALRERWFARGEEGAWLLLLLWPVALLFPVPVPFALGQVAEPLRQAAEAAVADTPWQDAFAQWIEPADDAQPLSPRAEGLAIVLGLLAPCLLVHASAGSRARRLVLVLAVVVIGFGASTLSTTMNFGPAHALTWLTPPTVPAIGLGLLVACATVLVGQRLAAGLGLVAVTAMVALVAQAPPDPYFAESLQAWQQGRFIRFHGLAQWIGWAWPYLAMAWLLLRLAGAGRERA